MARVRGGGQGLQLALARRGEALRVAGRLSLAERVPGRQRRDGRGAEGSCRLQRRGGQHIPGRLANVQGAWLQEKQPANNVVAALRNNATGVKEQEYSLVTHAATVLELDHLLP
ncbi:UNVERIFIED_CONTAM: hypothetical protein K2H54_054510, partial [Gekko kuhli]